MRFSFTHLSIFYCSYIGTCLEDNVVSIFMEFVPGGSIAWMLSKFQSFDENIISNYTRQILEAADYLHKKDIVHRLMIYLIFVNQSIITKLTEYMFITHMFDKKILFTDLLRQLQYRLKFAFICKHSECWKTNH